MFTFEHALFVNTEKAESMKFLPTADWIERNAEANKPVEKLLRQ